ncbi:MAG: hypothetical protein R3314_13975, partial [Longimicrobiales bacterium]|nr:hypothetical protein [Longimicrobiales bacterium]
VLDLILARPVRRTTYLQAPLLLVITGAVTLPLAILVGAVLGLVTVDAGAPWTPYLAAAGSLTLLLLAMGGIGLLAAVGAERRGPAVGRAVTLVLVFYWLDFVGPLWEVLETARWLSPFAYFDPSGAVRHGVSAVDAAVLLGVFVTTTAAAFLELRRQDL